MRTVSTEGVRLHQPIRVNMAAYVMAEIDETEG